MNELITILNELTALTTDVDLFAYEIPLGKSGLWVSDSQILSRFNGVNVSEFDIYYRGKTKQSCIENIKYLKDIIDNLPLTTCQLEDGTTFRLDILNTWDYLEKDSEGYFVFANRLRLFL